MDIHMLTSEDFLVDRDMIIMDRGEVENVVIRVTSGATLRYVFLGKGGGEYTRRFLLEAQTAFHGGSVIIGGDISYRGTTEIIGERVKSDFSLLGLALDGAHIDIRANSQVLAPYRQVHTRVDQTNILFGETVQIRGIPTLEVATEDIEGGHSCRVHRISGEALFYLQSHGLDAETAEGLLIDGELRRHTSAIGDCEPCNQLVGEIREILFPS